MTTCGLCDLQVSMCPDHVMPHRRFGHCLPFSVASMPGVGRCAVASRDIAPGEVVLEDEAVNDFGLLRRYSVIVGEDFGGW